MKMLNLHIERWSLVTEDEDEFVNRIDLSAIGNSQEFGFTTTQASIDSVMESSNHMIPVGMESYYANLLSGGQ